MEAKLIVLLLASVLVPSFAQTFIGCYNDDPNNRDFTGPVSSDNPTILGCETYCGDLGYTYFALQADGDMCQCDNSYGDDSVHYQTSQDDCGDMCEDGGCTTVDECDGLCGDVDFNAVYMVRVSNYEACYLNAQWDDFGPTGSPSDCEDYCQSGGYNYFGLRDEAAECGCSSNYIVGETEMTFDSECGVVCDENYGLCGFSSTHAVYAVPSASPSPSPTPVGVCGNGVVEILEDCDDGNTRSYDGCSSTCEFDTCPCIQGDCDEYGRCNCPTTFTGLLCAEDEYLAADIPLADFTMELEDYESDALLIRGDKCWQIEEAKFDIHAGHGRRAVIWVDGAETSHCCTHSGVIRENDDEELVCEYGCDMTTETFVAMDREVGEECMAKCYRTFQAGDEVPNYEPYIFDGRTSRDMYDAYPFKKQQKNCFIDQNSATSSGWSIPVVDGQLCCMKVGTHDTETNDCSFGCEGRNSEANILHRFVPESCATECIFMADEE